MVNFTQRKIFYFILQSLTVKYCVKVKEKVEIDILGINVYKNQMISLLKSETNSTGLSFTNFRRFYTD